MGVCVCVCVWEGRNKEGKNHQIILAAPSPPLQSSQSGVGVGYANPGCLSACPFRGSRAEQHAASCTHTLTHAECRGLGGSSLVSRCHTRLHVCTYGAETFLGRATLNALFLLSSVLLSSFSFPLLQHTFVLFSLPLFLSPPSSASLVFPTALSCVLKPWLVCGLRARWARCWCHSCLGSMSPSGPTEEDKTACEPGSLNTTLWESRPSSCNFKTLDFAFLKLED